MDTGEMPAITLNSMLRTQRSMRDTPKLKGVDARARRSTIGFLNHLKILTLQK
ncbi:MAG: hypothetical protein QXI48_06245 [Candidatus Bathyarchaeia archaeon]